MSATAAQRLEPGPAARRQTLPRKVMAWGARRPVAAAALIYALLSVAMFAPAFVPGHTLSASDYLWTSAPWDTIRPADVRLLGSNLDQSDAVLMWQPFMQHTRAALPDIPLWNPHIMAGRPFHANLQSATLSPFTVPAYVLPFWDSLAVMAALKLFVAALGTFLLARRFGLRFGGSLLAGLVYGFSLWAVTWVPWTTMSVWALVPWVALLAELCIRRPGPLTFAGLSALVGAQFFAGHPTSSFHLMVFTALFFTVRVLVVGELRRDRPLVRLATLGAALVAGTALAAITLVPFAELLHHSYDRTIREGEFADSYEPARYLLGVFFHDWWGRPTRTALVGAMEERAYYVAALPLMLAAAALVVRRPTPRVVVAVLGALAIAAGTGLPPAYDLVQALPGFDAVRNGRLAVFAILSLALLAGWGLDDLTSREIPRRGRQAILGIGLALAVLPVLYVAAASKVHSHAVGDALRVAWGFATPDASLAPVEGGRLAGVIRLASVLEWIVPAAAALVLLALRLRGRLGPTAFVVLALLLVAADLFKAGMGWNPAILQRNAVQPTTPAIRFLQAQKPARFAGLHPTAPISLAVPLKASTAMRYDLYDARGYDYPVELRYAELWKRVITPSTNCNYAFCPESAGTTPAALKALGILGVHDLLQQRRDAPLRGFRTLYDGPDARVYANPAALPRAFVVDRQVVVDGADAAREAITAPAFRPRSAVVTEAPISGLTAAGVRAAGSPPGEARISDYRDERVEIRTRTTRPGLLVLTDSFYPGWKATVDGQDAKIHRVDYLVRGVQVPAGEHTVRFRYEPASWRVGWITSAVALAVILGAVVLGLRRRRTA
ncbi:MAG TPA: YfhO family protein [Solirubrobacteraceae bacterium]|nr:YfhO family protein [Solirubrobacteraceae bacterium]